MRTYAGHTYRLQLAPGPGTVDPGGLTGPLSARYPADVVSIAALPGGALEAEIRWRDAAGGEIRVGDKIEADVVGMPAPVGIGAAPLATVIGVQEIARAEGPAALRPPLQIALAALILGTVVYFSHRIRKRYGEAA